jgi:hypothetical protein
MMVLQVKDAGIRSAQAWPGQVRGPSWSKNCYSSKPPLVFRKQGGKLIMAKYGKKAQKTVEQAMKRFKKGTLKSGKSKKAVASRKQAVAIGLSEARKKGAKVPPLKKKAAPKKKRVAAKKKKAAVKKKAVAKKKSAATRKRRATKKAA